MRAILLGLFFTLVAFSTFAQSKQDKAKGATVKGIIYDSINDVPLNGASIVFYNKADSTIKGFAITDYAGAFASGDLPIKLPMYYVVTYTGYNPLSDSIRLDSMGSQLDLGKINIHQLAAGSLEDVVVKSVVPIKMNNDTLEINPDAFKLDSNAVVEDMLLRVPGMVVWSDGTITMNGKKIEKLLVDGKPFFGGDTKIATQNLPKNAIKKIQLYQQKDLTKIEGVDNDKKDSLYSMNVQLKEDKKKGMFGKVNAGYGTDQRYDGSGVLQVYNPKNQAGIAFGLDNTNKTSGIGNDAFLQNTFKQSFMYFGYGDPNLNGIKKNIWGSAKWQHSFNEANNGQFYSRLTGDYTFKHTDLDNTSSTQQTDNLLSYSQTSNANSTSHNSMNSHDANILYDRRNKYQNFINISSKFNHTSQENNSTSSNNVFRNDSAISANQVKNYSSSNGNNVSLNMMTTSNGWLNQDNSLNSYNLYLNSNYGSNNSFNHTENIFNSFVDTISSNTLIRNYNTNSDNFNVNANLRYNSLRQLLMGIYNFYNIQIGLNNGVGFSRNTMNSRVQDLDTVSHKYITNDYLTNNNTLSVFSYSPGLNMSKTINKSKQGQYFYFIVMASLDHQWLSQKNSSSILYRNIDKNYHFWQPSLNMNFYKSKQDHYEVQGYFYGSYYPSTPDIDQLVPIVDTTNRYNVTVGNPYLKVGRNLDGHYQMNINRSKNSSKSSYGLSVNLDYSSSHNGIIDSVVYDAAGKSIRYLLNGDGRRNLGIGANTRFSSKMGEKYQLQFKYSPSYNISTLPGFINGIQSTSRNTNWKNAFSASFIILEKFNTTLGETISSNKNSQAGAYGISPTIRNYTTSVNATYSITKKWSLSSNFDYQSNQAQTNSSTASIWNATSTFRFMNEMAELKFTAFDLLHENKNIVNFLNNNSIGTTVTNGLQQYFMLTFSYYPRKFGGKEGRRNNIRL
ncbi:Outer membrane protein beta-barrel family protein [Arachidicoccus rhizosphaerae]|uniref:Outer membrane protein beta-barrel family protein n=1 Tax=Arachidicoccus rhizosphaerae TaxID=551991 RepID=A0A1H3VTU1_9BACT|nr:outer membrane beta-barrel protein [Arachidicoccus rhizosphaerae]SDZ77508.1 Outer membrane protein beta-barrel family protein [Arachidicoccus rhizosphaerae]